MRSVQVKDKIWTDFKSLFESKKSAPYSWFNLEPEIYRDVAKFDKRLISSLTYLSKKSSEKCGFDGTHQKITLKVDSKSISDLSYPLGNSPSTATLYRGTGVRITSVDEIKCTKKPLNMYCDVNEPVVFDQKEISLSEEDVLSPDKTYNMANCKVTCAVDYYPDNPIDAPADEISKPKANSFYEKLDPGEFDYQMIAENGKKAGIFKTSQVLYQLLNIDEPGCDNPKGNKSLKRKIPITIIASNYQISKMGNIWKDFLKLAEKEFPYNFQKGSQLAGLTYDPLLNSEGLHFNY